MTDIATLGIAVDTRQTTAARDNLRLLETQAGKTEKAANSLGRELSKTGSNTGQLQNVSYQLQDLIVQVNAGTSATQALGQQLPQLLSGFGKWGAVLGVAGAALPAVVLAMSNAGPAAKTLADAMGDLNDRIGDTGKVTQSFDMEKLYEEFNKSSKAVQAATIEQLNFQREFIRTTQLVANKKFGESLSDIGMPGLFSGRKSATEILAKDLGVTLDLALKLQPALNGLRDGTGSVNAVLEQFGTKLLGGNSKAIELAATMSELAKAERDAAAASSAISEAQAKMAKGHVLTKKEADELKKAHAAAAKEAESLQRLIAGINSKAGEFDANYVSNVESLLRAYDKGKLSLGEFNDVFARYVAMQPGARKAVEEAEKQQEEYNKRLMTGADALNKQAAALEREVEFYGMTESAIQAVLVARLEEARALAALHGAWEDHLDFFQREIDARKRIAAASSQREALDASRKSAEDAARQWDRAAADIERALTDSLMRAFESGKGFGDAFAKSLQATFKTMLLRVAVQAVVSPVQSAIGSALGVPGGGGALNLLGAANNVAGGGGGLIGSVLGSSGAYSAAIGGGSAAAGSQAAMLAAQTGEFGAAGLAATAEAAGAAASGALTSVAAAAPYVAAAIAVASALGAFDKQGAPKSMIGGGGRIGPTGVSYDPTGQAHWTGYTSSDRQLASTVLTDELVKAIQKINAGYTGGAFVKGEVNVKGSSSNQSLAQVTGASGQVLYHRFLEAGKGAEDFQRFAASEIPKLQLALMVDAMRQAGGKVKQIADDVIGTAGDLTDTLQQVDAGGAMARLQEAMAAMEQQATEAAAAVEAAQGRLREAYDRQAADLKATVDKFKTVSDSMRQFRQALMVGGFSPLDAQGRYGAARAQFESVRNRAMLGDPSAVEDLQSASESFLEASRAMYASGEAYARDFGEVLAAVEGTESTAVRQLRIAEQQLSELDAQVSALIKIDDSVLSVRDAISQLTLATLQAAQKGGVSSSSVAGLYRDVLGRDPDAAGLAYWQSASAGLTGDELMRAFLTSATAPGNADAAAATDWARRMGIPGFAAGGLHGGGLRLVGERGWEVEATGPARYWTADQVGAAVSGSRGDDLRAIREELRALRSEQARQTGDLISSNFAANRMVADRIPSNVTGEPARYVA